MALPPLLMLQNIHLTFGAAPLLEGASLTVNPGERLCLVGRNGSGKSTLLKIAAGLIDADSGERFVKPGVSVRYLPQEPDLSGFASVREFVEAGLSRDEDMHRARTVLESLGLSGAENPALLSGGETRRAALARVLAPEPDILLLDEPTNHLDVAAIEALEKTLSLMRSAMVLISHDRRFLQNLSNATLWLDRGRCLLLGEGFGAFEAWRDRVLEEEEIQGHKLARKIVNEEHWLRYGVSARRKRNQRRLGDLISLREQRKQFRSNRAPGAVAFSLQESRTSGAMVIEAKNISKAYGERSIVQEFSLRIERGDRIGIVGANGTGKTTLLNLLTGASEPDSGTLRLGVNLAKVTLDQRRASLDPETTLSDFLTGGGSDTIAVGEERRHVVGYMKDFLFRPEQARSPVKSLSGGERGRLMLAWALARPSNLLVLDEPTNDLDLETLDVLEEMLAAYPGTLLLVSHDRDFLDRVVTSTIAYEGEGCWVEYAGGYSDMLLQRRTSLAASSGAAPAPPRGARQPRATAAAEKGKQKLSFNDQQSLRTLPGKIESLGKEISKLEESLSDSSLYSSDPKKFAELGRLHRSASEALAQAEADWLRIELLREEIEGGRVLS